MTADTSILVDEALQNTEEEHRDPEAERDPLKGASPSYSQRSLHTEREHPVPVPAPRKSASKVMDERMERYSVLLTNFRQRWESVANIPKFQNFDRKTRRILQEQADRYN